MHEPPRLPPTAELHVLAHLIAVLEKHLPGLADDVVASMEDEAAVREVVRLRAPRETPEHAEMRAASLAWADRVRLLTLAHMARKRRRKERI